MRDRGRRPRSPKLGWLAGAIAAPLLTAGLFATASAPARSRGSCGTSTHTLASSPRLRLYALPGLVSPTVLVCTKPAGPSHVLGPRWLRGIGTMHRPDLLSGEWAAAGETHETGPEAFDLYLRRLNAQTLDRPPPCLLMEHTPDSRYHLERIIFNHLGFAAWMLVKYGGGQGAQRAVGGCGLVDHAELFEQGTQISPSSLTLAGGLITWTDAGAEHRAWIY